MAVSKHPSVRPMEPKKPPAVGPMKGEHKHGAGQPGVKYGSGHELVHHDGVSSRKHDFHDAKDGVKHMHKMAAERGVERIRDHAGDERKSDEPG